MSRPAFVTTAVVVAVMDAFFVLDVGLGMDPDR